MSDEILRQKAIEAIQDIYQEARDKKIKQLAEDYITEQYAPVGQRVYCWEVWDDPDDDLSSYTESGMSAPDEADYYSWSKVTHCEIIKSHISESNDETGEYCVDVHCLIATSEGTQADEDEDEIYDIEPNDHIIYVHIEQDDEGDYCVVGTEE
ncbi:hypothetical protein NIES37_62770 [Tolypothrix tenuis PCC 7101]|uniref:Uncharacterized protein n=1 Tax=Tolypothrix tenuis PCC 7101 TaxID=231146 RepID=A0A1Z4N997_9CYAN|nr:hypothetical protein [Aulosira sp. FACHB-113]BAZ02265.1 hypothetical protein NIES37_62770 [Tolypothrix tenuis PCC 7101]BAZ73814.1 hypothetical protein NIES50_23800 [Aulosira laxa NIES-50]